MKPMTLSAAVVSSLSALTVGLYEVYKVDPEYGGGWKVVSSYDKTESPAVLAEGTLEICLAWVVEQMEAV